MIIRISTRMLRWVPHFFLWQMKDNTLMSILSTSETSTWKIWRISIEKRQRRKSTPRSLRSRDLALTTYFVRYAKRPSKIIFSIFSARVIETTLGRVKMRRSTKI
jgi:hypothetical protein